ncbi:DUF7547 family protein [Halobiforma nitratireducens]|uniref:Uncharacterized protein n=1 Tax=Halobiforma nitratireducens JCM 10879 TaxID=1227454 RepID=M0M422_9EURY|nr:hypothetical protein [Halobiforma nitratireducens]EMA39115.1 hypothetical protein C446_08993 [Halobiforma nitratireducens JCM 10879]
MADNDELAEAIRELTATVDELRRELEDETSGPRRRPPFGLRPPTPRDVLEFTDDVALPAALAVLKASVRALESFQRGLELVRTEREVRDRTDEATAATADRAAELRRTTLSQLDTVLGELQRAASDGALPADEDARDLLSEARELRDEVDSRLRNATADGTSDPEPDDGRGWRDRSTESTDAITIDIDDGRPDSADDDNTSDRDTEAESEPDPSVDVDAELETLKDQYGPEAPGESGETEATADDTADDAEDDEDADRSGRGGQDAQDDQNGRDDSSPDES